MVKRSKIHLSRAICGVISMIIITLAFFRDKSASLLPNANIKSSVPSMFRRRNNIIVKGNHGSSLKAHIILNASPIDTFMCPPSHSRSESDFMNTTANHNNNTNHDQLQQQLSQLLVPDYGQRASFRIIETMDDHMDIIHLYFRPMYLFPSWNFPHDCVLFRYWRFDIFVGNRKNNSIITIYDSRHTYVRKNPKSRISYYRTNKVIMITYQTKMKICHHRSAQENLQYGKLCYVPVPWIKRRIKL